MDFAPGDKPGVSETRTLSADELFQRAVAACDAGRGDEGERLLRIGFKVAKGPAMLVGLGVALEMQGRFDEARAIFQAAVATTPDEPTLAFPLATNLLRAGDYAEGLRLYEQRPIRITPAMQAKPKLSFPEWTGGPVKSLLVLPEQGFGDEIMFNRFVPALRAQGIEVTLICRPNMARLFERLDVRLMPMAPSLDIPRADAWTLATSLPFRLGATPQSLPPAAYLPGGDVGAGVGVMTTGSAAPDPFRSLPPGLAAELLALPGAVDLDPAATGATDFEATRALIAPLDLVITVDTAVAHLAGAMGKPTWTLIPFRPDWRWGERGASPWYPQMRLFRQPKPLDWAAPVAEVKAAFAARA